MIVSGEREVEAPDSHCQDCIGMGHSLSQFDGPTWNDVLGDH
jgi:hypothetical protein